MILALGPGEIVLAHPYLFSHLGTVLAAPPLSLRQDSMIPVPGLGENVLALIPLHLRWVWHYPPALEGITGPIFTAVPWGSRRLSLTKILASTTIFITCVYICFMEYDSDNSDLYDLPAWGSFDSPPSPSALALDYPSEIGGLQPIDLYNQEEVDVFNMPLNPLCDEWGSLACLLDLLPPCAPPHGVSYSSLGSS